MENPFERVNNGNEGISLADAVSEIRGIRTEIAPTGAIDSEPNGLQHIEDEVCAGNMTPEEGVAAARRLRDGRQSYH